MTQSGRIIKQISNDYTVELENEIVVCKPRGKFRKMDLSPIVGDFVYSNGRNPFGVEGQMLHSCKLEFVHPTTNKKMKLEAKLPEYFEKVLEELRG